MCAATALNWLTSAGWGKSKEQFHVLLLGRRTCVDHMSVAEASSWSAALAPPLWALLRLKAASERPSAFVPRSAATLLSTGKSDCNSSEQQMCS